MQTKLIEILPPCIASLRTVRCAAAVAVVVAWSMLGAPQIVAQEPPLPPSDLTATAVSVSQIDLAWVNNDVAHSTGNKIFRSPDGITFLRVTTLPRTATTYSDTGLLGSVTYFYQVKATNPFGDSDPSNTASDATWPFLRLEDVCPGKISLAWRAARVDDHYDIQRSTDGSKFTVIATVPAPANSYDDSGLDDGTYFYRLQAFRMTGDSPLSNTIRAALGGSGVDIDHSGGFATHDDLTANGTAVFTGEGTARLTLNQNDQRGTIFSNDRVGIGAFSTTFTFRIHDTSPTPADGMTLIIHNDTRGSQALGPGGGGLTFGPDNNGSPPCQASDSIRNSVAIKFDIWNNVGEGDNSTGIFTDGRSPTLRCGGLPPDIPDISVDLRGTPIELKDDHAKRVDLDYDGTTLTETITDLVTMGTFTTSYTVDIPRLVGGDTAFVGFGGSTGGAFAIQEVLTWTFGGPASPLPRSPKGLRVTNVSGSDVTIAWKCNNAQTAQGFKIERSMDGGDFTQIDTVEVTQTRYTDPGLADGSYCYRVRSFNDQGDSLYSNVYCISLPVPTLVDHSADFATHDDLTGNVNTVRQIFVGNVARLTNGGFGQAGSVFANGRVDITSFMNTFTFLIGPPSTPIMGEGITFTIQGNTPTALGSNGGALGYAGISNSVAVKFDIVDNQGETDNSTGLFTDGHFPGLPTPGSGDVNVPIDKTILDLKSQDPFEVDMTYDVTTLALFVTITDTVTMASATQAYTVDIPSQVGSNLAYVGVTGSTGVLTATQDVQTWMFQSGPPARPSKKK